MTNPSLPALEFILRNYHNFNARVVRDAMIDYWRHIQAGGKMVWTLAGAMSTARLGISLAPAIRGCLIHAISSTGANLEESFFRAVAHNHYVEYPDYRYHTKERDEEILAQGRRRVTCSSIPRERRSMP